MELAQKAKIKWAIEGDENLKYYHGVLNKKRNQLAIRGILVEGSNSSFITLIPKTQEAKMMKDFRPITLIGSLYKIIAKILANRLVVVLEDLVSDVQSAFVAKRQILDGPFILNELFQWCKMKKKHTMIFKVDFEKAYDSVRWDYLDDVLKRFGFGEKWCGWIQNCLLSSKGSVIVNGSPTKEFQFHRGLKQGDPLSPFLFLLIMESLHISMQRVVDAGLFRGIQVGSSLQVSHLFYADDAVFMGHWSEANIDTILRVLDCFYHASGLRINMLKSKLMGISVSSDKVDQAAKKIGCAILQVPFSYLGSKVGCLMSRIQSWSEIVNNILTRLSKWKLKTLSIGGRLTLLKSVLGSLPIYHMSLFKVPAKVLLNMESIRCHFFNGIEHNGKKPIWVKWNKVLASKEKGGLGVSSFYALNRALLFKWVWRFCTQQSALWTKIIKGIHGEDGKIGKHVRSHHPSLWLDIVKEVQHIQRQGTDLMGFIHRKMGNGVDIRFWEDKWRGDNTFQSDFPRMYALETQKNISVALKLSHDDLLCSFRRAPRAGAEELQYIQLVKIMEGITLFDSKDRWRWSLEGCGEFTVASVRNLLDANSLPVVSSKTRWIKAVPIKVNIHAWKVKLDILPTRLNISKRGMDIESILCPLCEKNVESSSHIFFTCPISREIFRKVLLWWEIDVVMVSSYDEWLEWLLSIRLHSKHKELFEGVCYVLWWYIWNFRNKSIFGSACPSKALIFEESVWYPIYARLWVGKISDANRLVVVLEDLVSDVQSAFVAKRQILDGPFILNELFQWCKMKKKHTMIFKVDFEKAYDSVRWDYLDDVLKRFGFGEKWCGWIQNCLLSSKGSVIVNGSPTKEFQFHRGLKQGDPLSPFLFLLIMESLHISMQRVVDAGLFRGIQVGSSLQVSHLFYADDAVFMGHWSEANIDTILRVLDCFYHASGLRINMLKSKLMGISVSSDKVDQAAKKIGCAILQVPFSYLGSKVGCLMSRIQSWSEIVNNILTRLSKWKLKTLSIGGRLTLLKSVLGSLPIYHMSLFKVPAKVLLNMESIRCHFFNGIEHNGKKPIWVKWNKVLASKEKGGLGVSSFYALNRALLFKWVWRFCTQQSALWTKIIKGIHGEDGKIGKHVRSHHPSLWLDIVKEVQHIQRQGTDLMGFIHRKMGNGVDIRFWEDKWRGDNTFQSDFPRMYALETQKNISVALKLSHDDLLCSFRRAPRAGAEELQYIQLVKIMEGITLFDSKDRWRWSLEGCGEFTVASVRNLLDANSLPVVSSKTRWIKAVPIKVNIHAWKVKLDILPTRLNISKRGMDIESILCPLCEKNVESSSHIFFTCPISREIFRKVLLWWEIDVVMVSSYDEWLEWLLSIRLHSKHKELFEGVCYVLWWYIWNFHNKSIFCSACPSKALIFEEMDGEDVSPDIQAIIVRI
ncbi:RNA-directed DNA polymerase, eukaryota, reverse transcriptase zinc-binding domain protein [Tanacetum coccineum]